MAWTKEDFDAAYGTRGCEGRWGHPNTRPEVRLSYQRVAQKGSTWRLLRGYQGVLGPAAFNKRICIVGGAFGWAAQGLQDLGFQNLLVAEISDYVFSDMDLDDYQEVLDACLAVGLTETDPRTQQILSIYHTPGPRRGTIEIINADITTQAGRDAIKAALGTPQIVATEDVMPGFDDQGAIDFAASCRDFPGQTNVAHLVSVPDPISRGRPGWNWKTLQDWNALIPEDYWVNINTGEIL
jgi:hypothetical protein